MPAAIWRATGLFIGSLMTRFAVSPKSRNSQRFSVHRAIKQAVEGWASPRWNKKFARLSLFHSPPLPLVRAAGGSFVFAIDSIDAIREIIITNSEPERVTTDTNQSDDNSNASSISRNTIS